MVLDMHVVLCCEGGLHQDLHWKRGGCSRWPIGMVAGRVLGFLGLRVERETHCHGGRAGETGRMGATQKTGKISVYNL